MTSLARYLLSAITIKFYGYFVTFMQKAGTGFGCQ